MTFRLPVLSIHASAAGIPQSMSRIAPQARSFHVRLPSSADEGPSAIVPVFRCFFFHLLFFVCLAASCLFVSSANASEMKKWGIRSFSEEKPRYDAEVARLEQDGQRLDARRSELVRSMDGVMSGWTAEERLAGDKAYESREWSNNKLGGGRALARDTMEHYLGIYNLHSSQANPPDVSGDSQIQREYRGSLWGSHIVYLRSRNKFYEFDVRYLDDKLQYLKSYMPSSFDRFIGFSLDEFVNDNLEDFTYVLAAHSSAFFDELATCAAKEVLHASKQWALNRQRFESLAKGWTFKQRWSGASTGPGPSPSEFSALGAGTVVDCLEDVTRALVVRATVNGLRKNFVDQVTAVGVEPLVAEFWWSKYIIGDEAPSAEDPRAARYRGAWDVVTSRLEKGFASMFTLEFGLEQVKKSMEDELELRASKEIFKEVLGQAWDEYDLKVRMRGLGSTDRPLDVGDLRRQTVKRAHEIGKKRIERDAKLKFLDALDWGAMLLQQAVSSGTYIKRWYDFDAVAADLVAEYMRIEDCMVRQKLALSGPAILNIYRMPAPELEKFFERCGEIKADYEDLWAQRLLADMKTIHVRAASASGELDPACPRGLSALQEARKLLEHVRSQAKSTLEALAGTPDSLETLESDVESFEFRAGEASKSAESVLRALKQAQSDAGHACSAVEEFRSATDAEVRKSFQDQCEEAVRRVSAAAAEGARLWADAVVLRDAVAKEAQPLIRALATLRAFQENVVVVLGRFDELSAAVDSLAPQAAAVETAWAKLDAANTDAASVLKKAEGKLAGSAGDQAQGMLAEIRRMGREILAWHSGHKDCPGTLRTGADALAQEVRNLDLTRTTLEEKRVALGGSDSIERLSERSEQAVADTASAVEVGESFLEGFKQAESEARTCLELLRGSQTGGDAEIIAAADAAIDACRYADARALIDRLPKGPERNRLMEKLAQALATALKVSELRNAAEGLAQAGDVDAARVRLLEARSLCACEDELGEIDKQLAALEKSPPATDAGGGAANDSSPAVTGDAPGDAPAEPVASTPTDDADDFVPLDSRVETRPDVSDADIAATGGDDFQSLGGEVSATPPSRENVTYFDRDWLPRSWKTSGNAMATRAEIYQTASRLGWAEMLAEYAGPAADRLIGEHILAASGHMERANAASFAPHKAWPDWGNRRANYNRWIQRMTTGSVSSREYFRKGLKGTLSSEAAALRRQLETLTDRQAGSLANCDSHVFEIGYRLAQASQLQVLALDGLANGRDMAWARRLRNRASSCLASAGSAIQQIRPVPGKQGCTDFTPLSQELSKVQSRLSAATEPEAQTVWSNGLALAGGGSTAPACDGELEGYWWQPRGIAYIIHWVKKGDSYEGVYERVTGETQQWFRSNTVYQRVRKVGDGTYEGTETRYNYRDRHHYDEALRIRVFGDHYFNGPEGIHYGGYCWKRLSPSDLSSLQTVRQSLGGEILFVPGAKRYGDVEEIRVDCAGERKNTGSNSINLLGREAPGVRQ